MATRYEHAGAAVPTTLAADYDPADPTLSIASATGWPTGGVGPFVITIAAGTASEHKLLIESRTGTTLTVSDSSFDDTTDVAHLEGVAVIHSLSAKEVDEANDLASDITTLGGTPVTTSAAQTLTGKSVDLADNTVTMTKAELNAAVSDADVATLAGTETLTNKTLTAPAMTAPTATGDLTGFGGEWTAYTPTLTDATLGNGTITGRYMQVGKTVHFVAKFVLGSTSAVAAAASVSLPVAPHASPAPLLVGAAYDVSANTVTVLTAEASDDPLTPYLTGGGQLSATAPFTWATGDSLTISGTYEAA